MTLAETAKSKRTGKGKARLEPVRDAERTQQAILAAAERSLPARVWPERAST